MADLNILMVEDDGTQQTLYSDSIDEFNDDTQSNLSIEFVTTDTDAIEKLNTEIYDAVLLDLKLEGDNSELEQASGNNVLEHIINNTQIRLIVYVVSGTLDALEGRFDNLFENPLMRKLSRDSDSRELLTDLVKVHQTGVTKILGGSGKMESMLNDIFFNHLSKGFSTWVEQDKPCEKELLRYTALHLMEYLDLPESSADEEIESRYYNPEYYIYPPIKSNIATGDIVEYEGEAYILLSPSCDVAPRFDDGEVSYNVEVLILAKVVNLLQASLDELDIQYDKENRGRVAKFRSFADGIRCKQNKHRFHYLPAYLNINEGIIDFKRLINISLVDFTDADTVTRIATVSSPFIRDIQSRFSSYYGRQGQPSGHWSI